MSALVSDAVAFARLARGAVRPTLRYLSGRRVAYPEFGSQTVEDEDVSLARELLEEPQAWNDLSRVVELEGAFARWNNSTRAFSFMAGRNALSAAIHALQLKPGDEVLVPGYTCVVVPNAFQYAGIRVRYIDIELDTFGPDFNAVERAATSSTRAILVHHLYGIVARDLERILDFARARDMSVIEDCAHAMGAEFKGRKVGNFGDVAFFSTEQSKCISTFNGGFAVSNRPDVLDRLEAYQSSAPFPSRERTRRLLHNFILQHDLQNGSWRWLTAPFRRYRHRDVALQSTTDEEMQGHRPAHYGERMPGAVAALGLNQLRKLHHYNVQRRRNARQWEEQCRKRDLGIPVVIGSSEPVFLRYPVLVPRERKYDPAWCIREFGVVQGVWFSGELHPVARPMPECPNARRAVETCINLPTLGLADVG